MRKLTIILIIISGCSGIKKSILKESEVRKNKEEELTWHTKDLALDTIPGISLEKWYASQKGNSTNNEIIVAVLDTQVDITHEELKEAVWVNRNEIPNNGVDDDHNGYVDDIHGWNFAGTKSGNYTIWGNFEYVRVVRNWESYFKNKTQEEIEPKELYQFKEYQRALQKLHAQYNHYHNYLEAYYFTEKTFPIAKDSLKRYFPKENYTYQQLDSLYKKHKINDKTLRQRRLDRDFDIGAMIDFIMGCFERKEFSIDKISDKRIQYDSIVNKNLNVNYNERTFIGDDETKLEKGYGCSSVLMKRNGLRTLREHGTKVSGIIASRRDNGKGIQGFSNNIKIMPLVTSFSGDEHDKDIAMAIYYAVDNGAKVINMSIGKEFSLHKEWVDQAIKYAEEHDVLLIHVAGNDGFDIDTNPFYPNDYDYQSQKEIATNFINVGSICSKYGEKLVSNFSNYGKQNVDIFAPGEDVYTTLSDNNYGSDSGTSLAGPMVSGTAALIRSYYPNLTAQEVKQILLDSSTKYDIEVIVPGTKDKKVKFTELSKSGGVLNVYNAMGMAKKWSLKKRKS